MNLTAVYDSMTMQKCDALYDLSAELAWLLYDQIVQASRRAEDVVHKNRVRSVRPVQLERLQKLYDVAVSGRG